MADRSALQIFGVAAKADKAIDAFSLQLSAALSESIAKHAETKPDGSSTITPRAYALIRRDLDRALARIYGSDQGKARSSPMYRAIADAVVESADLAVSTQVDAIYDSLTGETELLKALTRGSD